MEKILPRPGSDLRSPATLAILAVSGAILFFLFWLIYFKPAAQTDAGWVTHLPLVNAIFNSLAAISLVGGWVAIRRQRRDIHLGFMLSAVAFSALFLVSYITYHHFHGDTKFLAEGWVRPVYFGILISHIVFSMVALPMVLGTLYQAARGRFGAHRRIARWTLPLWLYVSVTGVLVFAFLRLFN
jgi:putative membrane protein